MMELRILVQGTWEIMFNLETLEVKELGKLREMFLMKHPFQ